MATVGEFCGALVGTRTHGMARTLADTHTHTHTHTDEHRRSPSHRSFVREWCHISLSLSPRSGSSAKQPCNESRPPRPSRHKPATTTPSVFAATLPPATRTPPPRGRAAAAYSGNGRLTGVARMVLLAPARLGRARGRTPPVQSSLRRGVAVTSQRLLRRLSTGLG